jgi:hypothetical protein
MRDRPELSASELEKEWRQCGDDRPPNVLQDRLQQHGHIHVGSWRLLEHYLDGTLQLGSHIPRKGIPLEPPEFVAIAMQASEKLSVTTSGAESHVCRGNGRQNKRMVLVGIYQLIEQPQRMVTKPMRFVVGLKPLDEFFGCRIDMREAPSPYRLIPVGPLRN